MIAPVVFERGAHRDAERVVQLLEHMLLADDVVHLAMLHDSGLGEHLERQLLIGRGLNHVNLPEPAGAERPQVSEVIELELAVFVGGKILGWLLTEEVLELQAAECLRRGKACNNEIGKHVCRGLQVHGTTRIKACSGICRVPRVERSARQTRACPCTAP